MKKILLLWVTLCCNAEELKPTLEQLQLEVSSLKAQLALVKAEAKVMEMQATIQQQVCSLPGLMEAKLEAQKAREAAEKLKPKVAYAP